MASSPDGLQPKRYTAALRRPGARVKAIREDRGLSQESVAFDAEIHVNHLSSLEGGVANPSFLGVKLSGVVNA